LGAASAPVGSNGFIAQSGGGNLGQGQLSSTKTPVYNGRPVTTLDQVQQIIAQSTPTSTSETQSLAIPDVPDSDLAIDAKGASTLQSYLVYFNENSAKGVVFDASKFKDVLKDSDGVVIFAPSLISKALTDNNFSEVHSSLLAQKDFITAEIAFMKTIKVTGKAIAVNKEAIATQELLLGTIDKAFAVESGSLSKSDFVSYYSKFETTINGAHREFLAEATAPALPAGQTWFTIADNFFGERALAQSPFEQFGGEVIAVIPCPCSLSLWVTIGPPGPAELYVPFAFLAVWWLGQYDLDVPVPCLEYVGVACAPIGEGGMIIYTGTDLIPGF
jgi:hypothetical protein